MDSVIAVMKQAATGAVAGPLNGSFIMLATAITDNGPDTVLTNLTEATFTGYGRIAAGTWGPGYRDQQGRSCTDSAEALFQPTDSLNPNAIVAVCLVSAATAGTLLAYEVLPQPFQLPTNLQAMHVVATVCMDPVNDLGEFQVWS